MYKYRNCSGITRTFYGVQFKPGEVHEVPNAIVNPYFFRVVDLTITNMESAEVELVIEPIKTNDANGVIETVKEPVAETVEEIKFTPAVEVEKPKSRKGRKSKNTTNNEGDQ